MRHTYGIMMVICKPSLEALQQSLLYKWSWWLKSKPLINHFIADLTSSLWQEDFCSGSFNKLFSIPMVGAAEMVTHRTTRRHAALQRLIGSLNGLSGERQMVSLLCKIIIIIKLKYILKKSSGLIWIYFISSWCHCFPSYSDNWWDSGDLFSLSVNQKKADLGKGGRAKFLNLLSFLPPCRELCTGEGVDPYGPWVEEKPYHRLCPWEGGDHSPPPQEKNRPFNYLDLNKRG